MKVLGAAFVGAVVIAPLNEADAKFLSSGARGAYTVAPFKPVMFAENIIIGGPAPDVHQGDVTINSRNTILDECIKTVHSNRFVSLARFWRNKEPPIFLSVRTYWPFLSETPIDIDVHIFCRSTSGVCPDRLGRKISDVQSGVFGGELFFERIGRICTRIQMRVEAVYNDEGALCGFQCVSAGAPQLFGRSPESESEGGDSYTGQRSDRALININSMGGANAGQTESDKELDD